MNSLAPVSPLSRPHAPTLVCPHCKARTLTITDTERYDVPAQKGHILTVRTYRCGPCAINVRVLLVSVGETRKAFTRPNGFLTLDQAADPQTILGLL